MLNTILNMLVSFSLLISGVTYFAALFLQGKAFSKKWREFFFVSGLALVWGALFVLIHLPINIS